jgi:uncharacterized protein
VLRREFLKFSSMWLGSVVGCRRARGPREVLEALMLELVVPDTRDVASTSESLASALSQFEAAPSSQTLSASRKAWRNALEAWKRAQCFGAGPLVETNALVRSVFWPARPAAVSAALASRAAIDQRFVGDLGVDAKGLYALEFLLFPGQDDSRVVAEFSGEAGSRRRRLAVELARNVREYSSTGLRALGDGIAAAHRFSQDSQASLSALVGHLISNVESLAIHKLALPLELQKNGMLTSAGVEGTPSGTSQSTALVQMLAFQRIYFGDSAGVQTLARAASPEIDERVSTRFADAVAAVRAIAVPLDRAARDHAPRLATAAEVTKGLEICLKVDLISTLGLTLTFPAGDGD